MPICCYPFLPTILLEQYIGCVEKSEKSVKKDISREQHGILQSKAVGATYSTEKASMGAGDMSPFSQPIASVLRIDSIQEGPRRAEAPSAR